MDSQKIEINFCPNCGNKVPVDNAIYCIHCGSQIRETPNFETDAHEIQQPQIDQEEQVTQTVHESQQVKPIQDTQETKKTQEAQESQSAQKEQVTQHIPTKQQILQFCHNLKIRIIQFIPQVTRHIPSKQQILQTCHNLKNRLIQFILQVPRHIPSKQQILQFCHNLKNRLIQFCQQMKVVWEDKKKRKIISIGVVSMIAFFLLIKLFSGHGDESWEEKDWRSIDWHMVLDAEVPLETDFAYVTKVELVLVGIWWEFDKFNRGFVPMEKSLFLTRDSAENLEYEIKGFIGEKDFEKSEDERTCFAVNVKQKLQLEEVNKCKKRSNYKYRKIPIKRLQCDFEFAYDSKGKHFVSDGYKNPVYSNGLRYVCMGNTIPEYLKSYSKMIFSEVISGTKLSFGKETETLKDSSQKITVFDEKNTDKSLYDFYVTEYYIIKSVSFSNGKTLTVNPDFSNLEETLGRDF